MNEKEGWTFVYGFKGKGLEDYVIDLSLPEKEIETVVFEPLYENIMKEEK